MTRNLVLAIINISSVFIVDKYKTKSSADFESLSTFESDLNTLYLLGY